MLYLLKKIIPLLVILCSLGLMQLNNSIVRAETNGQILLAEVDVWGTKQTGTTLQDDYVGTATGLSKTKDPRQIVADIIEIVLGFLGISAVILILIGGFKWMTAGGNDEGVAEAKKWIISGVIGLVIILASYALASFVLTQLGTVVG